MPIKFYQEEQQVPLEMHKVRVVQKLFLRPIEERLQCIKEAGNNTFLLQNKDVFMDSGINVNSLKDLPAARFIGASWEAFISAPHSPMELTLRDTLLQREMICGSEMDENGVLLYPDGEPRFRVIYMNGGKATAHGRSLTPAGRSNMQKFLKNGGSYVGTCAGAYISSMGTKRRGEEVKPNEDKEMWGMRAS